MSRRLAALHLAPWAALLGVATWPAYPAAAPSAADLARCAGIAAPDTRLACYDALAGRPAPAAATTPASTPAAPVAKAPVANSAPPPAAAAVPPSAPATPAPSPSFASDPRNFGFSEAQLHAQTQPHAAPEGPDKIQAQVAKLLKSSGTGQFLVVLDNAQTWKFVDPADDAGLSPGDPVTIKRGSLGSFLLLTPSKHSYHVRRMQ